ncbi:MAG: CvpA family protein [Phocaeicola sp.]|uniref:CvpA family protein n=1 Tax=Phocaeicola sp. TaxID=2773926 RepID=UPI003F9FBFF1
MATIDIVILVVIAVGVVQGFMQGLLKQMASIVGFIAGLLLARALFGMVGEQLAPSLGTSTTFAQILAFILIWIIVPVGFSLIALLLTKAMGAIHLGWLNRWLGSGLGAIKFILLIGLFIHVFEFIDTQGDLLPEKIRQESVFYKPAKQLTDIFFPAIKGMAKQIF